jgi:esterase/lipase
MKKTIKPPLALRLISWGFPKVELLAPWLAKRWFVDIFFSTAKYKLPYGEVEAADKASKYQIQFEGKAVQVYEWGVGKPVLMVHGWMGRATQFRKFISSFNAAGYKVVSFDATGHGKSDGKKSHIMEFADIAELLAKRYNGFEMIIGHSLGGVAAMHSIVNGAETNKLIMISSPTIGSEIVKEFRKKIKATEDMVPYFESYVKRKFGKNFKEYSAEYIIDQMKPIDLLLIYDKDDREVSHVHPEVLIKKYPSAQFINTEGLGHTRILKDEIVIEKSLSYLVNKKNKTTRLVPV